MRFSLNDSYNCDNNDNITMENNSGRLKSIITIATQPENE